MAKDFTQMSDAELGKCFRSRYDRLVEAHDMGLDDGPHPSERWASDTEILHAHRAACASDEESNTGLGRVTIQKRGTPSEEQGLDDQPENSATPGPNAGKKPAMDSDIVGMFGGYPVTRAQDRLARTLTTRTATDSDGNASLLSADVQSINRVRAMKKSIPGYSRLR